MARPRIGEKVQTTVPVQVKRWAEKQVGEGIKEADVIRELILIGFERKAEA